jgi:hypothetical protein
MCVVASEFAQSFLDEPPFRFLARQSQRAFVGGAGVVDAPKAAA